MIAMSSAFEKMAHAAGSDKYRERELWMFQTLELMLV